METANDLLKNFSHPARLVLFFARRTAGARGAEFIEPDDLLDGVIAVDQGELPYLNLPGLARPVLGYFPVRFLKPEAALALREAMSVRSAESTPLPETQEMPVAENAQKILISAYELAKDAQVTPLHLLKAIAPEGVSMEEIDRAINSAGVPAQPIRVLTSADAEAWWNLRLEALEAEPFAFGKTVEEHRQISIKVTGARLSETPDSFTLGAFAGGRLVGAVTFMRETAEKLRHKGRVFGVYVTPTHRRYGIGRALMSSLVQKARRDASLEQILLDVTASNDQAIGLYRRLGFETWGREPRAMRVGSDYADTEHMILNLLRPASL